MTHEKDDSHLSRREFLETSAKAAAAVAVAGVAPALSSGCSTTSRRSAASGYDILIKNGSVYDGTGAAPVVADIGIRGDRIAAVIVEPVAGNMGLVAPQDRFLPSLRDVCDQYGAVLIFDEVMTGFRVAWGGAQSLYDVRPDLTCLGKVIGGGLPLAAVFPANRDELVQTIRLLHEARAPFVPRGAGTGLAGGAVAHEHVLVCTTRMRQILELNAEGRTALLEPGVLTDAINRAAEPYGLRYLPDPASAAACCVTPRPTSIRSIRPRARPRGGATSASPWA